MGIKFIEAPCKQGAFFNYILLIQLENQHIILSKEKKMDTISITFINLETINIHFNGYLLHFRGDIRYHLF